jgi:hypothetical protein
MHAPTMRAEINEAFGDVKNILRTLQRVLSASCKDQKVPFSQNGLAIPEKDNLQFRIDSRENVSYSWEQTLQIVEQIKTMDTLGAARREQYSTLFLVAAASGLRIGALRKDDIGENTIRVDESVDRAGANLFRSDSSANGPRYRRHDGSILRGNSS